MRTHVGIQRGDVVSFKTTRDGQTLVGRVTINHGTHLVINNVKTAELDEYKQARPILIHRKRIIDKLNI